MNKEKPSPESFTETKKPQKASKTPPKKEIGGFKDQNLLEPTRYGDWDVKGRCSDF